MHSHTDIDTAPVLDSTVFAAPRAKNLCVGARTSYAIALIASPALSAAAITASSRTRGADHARASAYAAGSSLFSMKSPGTSGPQQ